MHFGIIIGTIGGYIYYASREPEVARNILPLLFVTIGFGIIGFIDDYKKLVLRNTEGLKPAYKMLGLLIISVAFTLYLTKGINLGTDTFIPFVKKYYTIPMSLYIPFVIFVMLGTTNAVNLTDGIDRFKYFYFCNYYNMFNSYCNYSRYKRNSCFWKHNCGCMFRIFNI